MVSPCLKWHSWERIKFRILPHSQHKAFLDIYSQPVFRYLPSKTEIFIQRLVLLTWIGEIHLAQKLWEQEKNQHNIYGFPISFEEFLFRVLIWEKVTPGPVYYYPEFHNIQYLILDEEDAFKLSTTPLLELLKMDKPHFQSVDGLIKVDFNKEELGRIAKIVPDKYKEKVRLPLILLKNTESFEYEYLVVGTKLENMLLQKLLKKTEVRFDEYDKIEEMRELDSISTLRRRRLNTIYKILPESSMIWLNIKYQNPI